MSAGGCSLAGRRDNVPCLAITAIWVSLSRVYLQQNKKKARAEEIFVLFGNSKKKVAFFNILLEIGLFF